MEIKYLGRNYRRWNNWTMCTSKQNKRWRLCWFLRDNLPDLLEDFPLNIRQNIWFQHDGAPPHYSRRIRHYLDTDFPNSWIGRGGSVAWPARSWSELSGLLFVRLCKRVYLQKFYRNVGRIRRTIHCVIGSITPEMLQLTQQSLIHRAHAWIQMRDLHFEHLLKMYKLHLICSFQSNNYTYARALFYIFILHWK